MKIQIEGNLYIESDNFGYQVKQFTGTRYDEKKEQDVDMFNVLANYGTVKGCCKYILNMKVKDSAATTLSELIQDVQRIETYIESKINF